MAATPSTSVDLSRLPAPIIVPQLPFDTIVAEPLGGAHRAPQVAIASLGDALEKALKDLSSLSSADLRQARRAKFLKMGRL